MRLSGKMSFVGLALVLFLCGLSGCRSSNYRILLVLTARSEVSYESVKEAVVAWAEEKGVELEVLAPAFPEASGQQAVLEQALGSDWDVICIEPLGGAELEPLLEYARDSGTVVVSARGGELVKADYNIEPFSGEEMGRLMMDALAASMEESGLFLTTVPDYDDEQLLNIEHEAIRRQQTAYGPMLPASRLEVTENNPELAAQVVEQAYEKYMISGVLFFSHAEAVGIGSFNNQNGRPLSAVGIGDAELLKPELEQGNIDALFYWDRKSLICAALDVGYYAASGKRKELGDIIGLPYEGYEDMRKEGENTWVAGDIRQSFSDVSP